MITNYIADLSSAFAEAADPEMAKGQAAYMRNQFSFLGITAKPRMDIMRPFLRKSSLPQKSELPKLIKLLWERPERDFQYFGLLLAEKYLPQMERGDIETYIYMVTQKSWWDTVDFTASKLIGIYFRKYPEEINPYMDAWLASGDIWLQRCTLIFQLRYRENVDHELLATLIQSLHGTKEFFINKAIGWALREYGKYNPEWVKEFVAKTKLSQLSKREALRRIED